MGREGITRFSPLGKGGKNWTVRHCVLSAPKWPVSICQPCNCRLAKWYFWSSDKLQKGRRGLREGASEAACVEIRYCIASYTEGVWFRRSVWVGTANWLKWLSTIVMKFIICDQTFSEMENALKHERPVWKLEDSELVKQAFEKEIMAVALLLWGTSNILIRTEDEGVLVSSVIFLESERSSFKF